MNKELIINAAPQAVEIALLEDKKLVELHSEQANANFAVGDLYLGKVKKLIPGLNAALFRRSGALLPGLMRAELRKDSASAPGCKRQLRR